MTTCITPALRQIITRRAPQVRRRVKFLLSTHPHPATARLPGGGPDLPTGLMHDAAQSVPVAAVCPGGGVGGLFIQGCHAANVGAGEV